MFVVNMQASQCYRQTETHLFLVCAHAALKHFSKRFTLGLLLHDEEAAVAVSVLLKILQIPEERGTGQRVRMMRGKWATSSPNRAHKLGAAGAGWFDAGHEHTLGYLDETGFPTPLPLS